MHSKPRRQFILHVAAGSTLLASGRAALAQANQVQETDAQATALGYKHDATKVDAKKYPTYAAGRVCSNCMQWQGKPTDAWAGCGVFAGKQVNGKGWCTAWIKKA